MKYWSKNILIFSLELRYVNLFTNKYFIEYVNYSEGAGAVEESDEVTLHYSIRRYHIAMYMEYIYTAMENLACFSKRESSYNAGEHWIHTPTIESTLASTIATL